MTTLLPLTRRDQHRSLDTDLFRNRLSRRQFDRAGAEHGTGAWDDVQHALAQALLIVQGATDTATFEAYVEQALAPQLHPCDAVIWDNLKPHKAKSMVKAVKGVGVKVIPLPPSSPDYSPIEEMFSRVKDSLKSAAARTTDTLTTAIGCGLGDVLQQDIIGWFKSRATYAMQS
ncbi:DDE superfamily endonuclease [Singulisphaera sp. GP187]|nr:DDE superfamily endonuclease [Singulisphaera sp. GP187]